VLSSFSIIVRLAWDMVRWCGLLLRPRESVEAENLFLRRQLALYLERGVKPRRVDAATRVMLTLLSRWFDWRSALVVVRPETLIGWHRAGFRLFWRWKSRAGRPPIPKELRELIRRMAEENPMWGQERIANELLLKLGLRVSPRTVAKYMPRPAAGQPRGGQRWWTRQQLREVVGFEERYECLLHDRDSIFSAELDESIQRLGLRVLKSPPRSPKANSICERVIGTIRRECLDWLIPLSEAHLRQTLKSWMAHYNRGRPHSALGPGVPDPPEDLSVSLPKSRHRLADFRFVHAKAILGGLHHEYSLVRA
jgi:putative transposase